MCLSIITDANPETGKSEVFEGWKVFNERDGKLYGQIYGYYDEKPLNRWITANTNDNIRSDYSIQKYRQGFHIFTNRADAREWRRSYANDVILKVKYRKLTCVGYQHENKVVVAEEILITNIKG